MAVLSATCPGDANQAFAALRRAEFLVRVRLKPAPAGPKVELVKRAATGRKSDICN